MSHLNDLENLIAKTGKSLKEAHNGLTENATEEDKAKIQSLINKELEKSIESARQATKGTPLEGIDIMGGFLKDIYK